MVDRDSLIEKLSRHAGTELANAQLRNPGLTEKCLAGMCVDLDTPTRTTPRGR